MNTYSSVPSKPDSEANVPNRQPYCEVRENAPLFGDNGNLPKSTGEKAGFPFSCT